VARVVGRTLPGVVVSRWSVVDPKIAAWMLDPDHPPITFQQTIDQWMSEERKSTDCLQVRCRQPLELSLIYRFSFRITAFSCAYLWQFSTIDVLAIDCTGVVVPTEACMWSIALHTVCGVSRVSRVDRVIYTVYPV